MAEKQIGFLWKKDKGHLSGNISLGIFGEIKIVIFPNKYKKEGSKQPDFHIIRAKKFPGQVDAPDEDFEPLDCNAEDFNVRKF